MSRTEILGLVAVAVALGGCPGPFAAKRVASKEVVHHPSVPYPVGDPVAVHTEQSGPRLRLGASKFMLAVPGESPRLVGRVLLEGEPGFVEIYEAAFGKIFYDGHDLAPVDAKVLAAAGIESPGDSVLVVGDEGPCRAGLGEPGAELFGGASRRLEVSWPLAGCAGESIAPVAVLADRLPDVLRWRPAVMTVDATITPDTPWKDPLGAHAIVPEWPLADPAEVAAVQVWQIADTDPTVVSVYRGLARAPIEGADPCAQPEVWMQTNGWWNGQWLDPIEPGDDLTVAPQLLGAFVHDTQIDALVYAQRDAPLVAVPPATTPDGKTTDWVLTLVDPGLVPPADTPVWAWSMLDRTTTWRRACDQSASSESSRSP